MSWNGRSRRRSFRDGLRAFRLGQRQQLIIILAFGVASILVGIVIVAWQRNPEADHRRLPESAASTAAPSPTPTTSTIPGNLSIYFLGDSITAGYFASDVGHSYRAALLNVLEQTGHTVRPALATDSQAAYGGKAAETASHYSPASDADVLVVELGTNDYSGFGAPSPTTLADFSKSYAGILDAARQARASVKFVCDSIWQPASQPNALGIPATSYDQIIQSACNTRGGLFITVQRIYFDQANHSSPGQSSTFGSPDGFHPGNAGHLAIARAIYRVLPLLWT